MTAIGADSDDMRVEMDCADRKLIASFILSQAFLGKHGRERRLTAGALSDLLEGASGGLEVRVIADAGNLELRPSTGELIVVLPSEDVEAWQLEDENGLIAVGTAGGVAEIWMPASSPPPQTP